MSTNIAVLSAAHIHTQSFLENIRDANDDRKALVLWDADYARGQRYAQKFSVPFEPDFERVLDNPEVDGFLICAENTRHLALLERTLPLGKPVFCEKPLGTSTQDVARIRSLLERYKTVLTCGYFFPDDGGMRAVAALLERAELGAITHVRYCVAHHGAYGRWFDSPDLHWFTEPELAGGGGFLDLGSHGAHLLRTLFGPVKYVWATIGNHGGIYPTVDDFGVAHLKFENGIFGTLEANWIHRGPNGLEVQGSSASIIEQPKLGLMLEREGASIPIQPLEARLTRVDRLVAAIRGELPEQDWRSDLEASLEAVKIIEAAYRSSEAGRWIELA